MEQLAADVAAGRRLGGSLHARSQLAKGGFASKVLHTFSVQAPHEPMQKIIFDRIQKVLNSLVFGGFYNVTVSTACQPPEDGGLAHVSVERRVRAGWMHYVSRLMQSKPAVWKNIWWYNLRCIYGPLACKGLLATNCTFAQTSTSAAVSEVQRHAMLAWGAVTKTAAYRAKPEETERM